MASGNTLVTFFPQDNEPPSSNYATLDTRNGHLVLDFDASTDESAIFTGVLPSNYAGGGVTATIIWAATSATANTCRWHGFFERLEDEGTDTDSDSFDSTGVAAGGTAPGTSGALQYTALAFSSGARMDSLAATEAFRFKLTRDADGTGGTDDMTGDAELFAIVIKET